MKSRSLFLRFSLGAAALAAVAFASPLTSHVSARQAGQDKSGDAMSAQVGKKAPDFTLTDLDGKKHTLSDYTKEGKIVVLEWFNPMCPFVVRHHEQYSTMKDTFGSYKEKGDGVVWLAVNSAHTNHPTTGAKNNEARDRWEIGYPILLDESGDVGHMYGAKTTPHMYIIDADGILRYAGAIDNDQRDSMSGTDKVNYVSQALDEILAGDPVSTPETKPYGCSVKYGRR